MSTPFSEELLSAYLDGELTPAEQAEVERHLENSSHLRELLEELADASVQIRALPTPSAPADLHQQILSQIDAEASSDSSVSPAARPVRNRWIKAALSVVTACALVAIVIRSTAFPPASTDLLATHQAESVSAPALAVQRMEVAQEMESPSAPASSFAVPMMATMAAPAVGDQDEQGEPVHIVHLSRDEIRSRLVELDRPLEAGESFTLSYDAGEIPLLVEYTVIDERQSVDHVQQVLLKLQQVKTVSADASVKNLQQSEDQQLVLLEMDLNEIPSVLNEIPALSAVLYEDLETSEYLAQAESGARFDAAGSMAQPEPQALQEKNLAASSSQELQSERLAGTQSRAAQNEAVEEHQRNFNFERVVDVAESRGTRSQQLLSDSVGSQAVPLSEEGIQTSPLAEADQNLDVKSLRQAAPAARQQLPPSGSWEQARKMRAILVFKRQVPVFEPRDQK